MSRLATKRLHQYAVLWMASGSHNATGEPTLNTPTEIKVRWEENRAETLDSKNDRVAIDANVAVDREITEGSILWKGKLLDHTTGTSTNYKQVVAYSEIPDVKGRNPRRLVTLIKHSDTLPDLA
jgi:hypothetical protein